MHPDRGSQTGREATTRPARRGKAPGALRSPPSAASRRPAPLQRPDDRPSSAATVFWLDAAGLQQLYEEKVGCSDLLALLGDGPARLSGTQRYMSALRVVLCSPVEPRFGCRLPTEGVLCSTFAAAADNNPTQTQLVRRPASSGAFVWLWILRVDRAHPPHRLSRRARCHAALRMSCASRQPSQDATYVTPRMSHARPGTERRAFTGR